MRRVAPGMKSILCAVDPSKLILFNLVLPRFGTFSPYKAIFNSKGPNRGSTNLIHVTAPGEASVRGVMDRAENAFCARCVAAHRESILRVFDPSIL